MGTQLLRICGILILTLPPLFAAYTRTEKYKGADKIPNTRDGSVPVLIKTKLYTKKSSLGQPQDDQDYWMGDASWDKGFGSMDMPSWKTDSDPNYGSSITSWLKTSPFDVKSHPTGDFQPPHGKTRKIKFGSSFDWGKTTTKDTGSPFDWGKTTSTKDTGNPFDWGKATSTKNADDFPKSYASKKLTRGPVSFDLGSGRPSSKLDHIPDTMERKKLVDPGKSSPRFGAKSFSSYGRASNSPYSGDYFPTSSYGSSRSKSYGSQTYPSMDRAYSSALSNYKNYPGNSAGGGYGGSYGGDNNYYGNSPYQSDTRYGHTGGHSPGMYNSYTPGAGGAQSNMAYGREQSNAPAPLQTQYAGAYYGQQAYSAPSQYTPQERSLYGGSYNQQPMQGNYYGQPHAMAPSQYPPTAQGSMYPNTGAYVPQQMPSQGQGDYPGGYPYGQQHNPLSSNPDEGLYFDEEAFKQYLEKLKDSTEEESGSQESGSRDYSLESRDASVGDSSMEYSRSSDRSDGSDDSDERRRSKHYKSKYKSRRPSHKRSSKSKKRRSKNTRPESRDWSDGDDSNSRSLETFESFEDSSDNKKPQGTENLVKRTRPKSHPSSNLLHEETPKQAPNMLSGEPQSMLSDILGRLLQLSAAKQTLSDQQSQLSSVFSSVATTTPPRGTFKKVRLTSPLNRNTLNDLDRLAGGKQGESQRQLKDQSNEIDQMNSYETGSK